RVSILAVLALAVAAAGGIAFTRTHPARSVVSTALLQAGEVSFWNGTATPRLSARQDDKSIELGTRFDATAPGVVTAILFYQPPPDTGPHTGALWDSTGRLLASARFTTETPHGWQIARLAAPVRLAAGTGYVVSYHAPNGRYADDTQY